MNVLFCHTAGFNSLVDRLLNVPINTDDYNDEINTIKYIATTNGYNDTMIDKLIYKYRNKKTIEHNKNEKTGNKFVAAKYTNIIPDILKNILKKANITVGFKTEKNIYNILKTNYNTRKPFTEMTGIYKITCNSCDKFYLGQTGKDTGA